MAEWSVFEYADVNKDKDALALEKKTDTHSSSIPSQYFFGCG